MNPVVRGLIIYLFILIVFRFLGKRSLAETTTFDLVLLLIISEATTDALIGEDYSITAALIMISTLVGIDYIFCFFKDKFKLFDKISDGTPLVIIDNGIPLKERMKKSKVGEEDILEAARLTQGLETMDQIKYAVLERDGSISIIPMKPD